MPDENKPVERWRVIHPPNPRHNEGTYLADSYEAAQKVKWKILRDALDNGCRHIYVPRVQKLVGDEWVDVEKL